MNPKTKSLLIVGALGAAAVYAASKSSMFGGSAEAGGSLGGSDDSLTNDSNPFAGIDPNYQYPGPENNYFVVQPDGSIVPVSQNPDTGALTIPTSTGEVTQVSPGSTETGAASTGETTAIPEPKASWYENPLAQGALFGAGYLAVEGTIAGIKKISAGKASGKKLVGEAKTADVTSRSLNTEKSPLNEINEKLGFKANERMPEQEILKAKYTTDADFSSGKIGEVPKSGKLVAEQPASIGKVKVSDKVMGKVGTAGKVVTKAAIVGHVIGREFQAFNEYGAQYLEPRTNVKGEVVGATAGSTAKAVAVTGAVGTTGILGDLFGFFSGLVYRPKTSAEEFKDMGSGWFATEKDLFSLGKEVLTNPKQAWSDISGMGEIMKAVNGSTNGVSGMGTPVSVSSSIFDAIQSPVSKISPQKSVAENLAIANAQIASGNLQSPTQVNTYAAQIQQAASSKKPVIISASAATGNKEVTVGPTGNVYYTDPVTGKGTYTPGAKAVNMAGSGLVSVTTAAQNAVKTQHAADVAKAIAPGPKVSVAYTSPVKTSTDKKIAASKKKKK